MITSPYVHDEYKEYIDGDAPSSSFWFPLRYVNLKVLSHIAVQSQELPRGTHVTGGIPYPGGFMGKDIVMSCFAGTHSHYHGAAYSVCLGLHQNQLFFDQVEWVFQDGVEDVCMFLDDLDGSAGQLSSNLGTPS
ncbi:hypothetical protein GGU11DRAFT_284554 [Lentinula aff. detonsa]|nr:hypothetical protein GGU11DRAFT_284554 [Lentinula aff. detonsa]